MPDLNARILVADDERPMRTALADGLAAAGYRVLTAEDGQTALAKALREKPDLILLDVMMPRLDGFAVCAELRRLEVTAPILFLTAKGMVQDRVLGLDSGGDDYLVKPFSTEELLARVRALLRRGRRSAEPVATLELDELHVDFNQQRARKDGRELRLTAKEFAVLRLLASHPGEPISRERFLDVVWGYAAFPTTRTVDNHIAMLRAKIEPNPADPRYLLTVHGVGYKLAILQSHDNAPPKTEED